LFWVAPALIAYNWALGDLGKIGWLSAFLFTAATALRLARFNTQVSKISQRYFQGLPSPAAAANIAALVWILDKTGMLGSMIDWYVAGFTVFSGILMVSNIRYHSFKQFDLRGKVPFVTILIALVIFVLIAVNPAYTLFAVFFSYLLSGPLLTLWHLFQRRKKLSK
jgi:CDP-diacylglycerol---serine O-phosphatidyltransferase